MHTNLSAQSRKIFLVSLLGGIILILFSMGGSSPIAHARKWFLQGCSVERSRAERAFIFVAAQAIRLISLSDGMTIKDPCKFSLTGCNSQYFVQ